MKANSNLNNIEFVLGLPVTTLMHYKRIKIKQWYVAEIM